MNWPTKVYLGMAATVAVLSAVLALDSLQSTAEKFQVNWGIGFYAVTPLPYVIAAILAFSFRRNATKAAISLARTLAVGPLGVYAMRTAEDALTVQFAWFLSLLGCIVILITQLFIRQTKRGAVR